MIRAIAEVIDDDSDFENPCQSAAIETCQQDLTVHKHSQSDHSCGLQGLFRDDFAAD
jgi:hypothetical protein